MSNVNRVGNVPVQQAGVLCPDCTAGMDLTNGKFGLYYKCRRFPHCLGRRGCNQDGIPHDRPDDRRTRQARIQAHAAFDAIWKGAGDAYDGTKPHRKARSEKYLQQLARGRCYAWLSEQLGIPEEQAHMSRMDYDTCIRTVEACQGITYTEIRAWWKEREAEKVGR